MTTSDILFARGVQRVLAPILLSPECEFRHSELVAKAGTGRGGGQNAIRSILQAGIATYRRSGNQVLVSANRSHPLFQELRSICLKTFGVADRIRAILEPWSKEVQLAFVFGAIVSGVGRADAAVGLVVVGGVDLLSFHRVLSALEDDLGRPVNLNVYDPLEWETLRNGPKISGILASPKTMIIGDDPAPQDSHDLPIAVAAPSVHELPDPHQVAQYVLDAETLLADARNPTLAPHSRVTLACEGIQCLAMAVLNHYTVGQSDDRKQGPLALQMLMAQAGLGTAAIRLVSRAYQRRNDTITRGRDLAPSLADADALVEVFATTFAAIKFLTEAPPVRFTDRTLRRR